MAIFTALAGIIAAAVGITSTFAIGAIAVGLSVTAAIALNYVAQALSGKPADTTGADQDHFGAQGTLAAGGDVPRSFGLGYHMTAGSLVYANYWGQVGQTPNAYFTQVIAVSDLPREQLLEVWVSGERCTLVPAWAGEMGTPLEEYNRPVGGSRVDHLWIKYYDGTQTAADTFLTSKVSSTDRPYLSSRVGKGMCFVICTALVEDTLFTGFPSFKFALSGIPLYDPSKDSTNGGSGAHRYSDPSTWGGDGDQLPAVQCYNLLRGIKYNGAWFYGLQNMGPARLPAVNWISQIQKCRATITGETGLEPTYRSGGQINVSAQPANAAEALLTACLGRLSEIGGFYKIHVGEPDASAFAWADADILSSEEQVFRPFFALADSVNGIQGTYPDPAQGWETATAPALYRTDLEVKDGNRRLMANPQFSFVPYRAQVQRLQKSGIEEAQRARTHVIVLPPSYWPVEPGDVGTWNSFRNGYVDKLFRVDSVSDRANLDVVLNVTEIDPSDYDWNHAVDFTGVSTGPTVFPRPAPQGVIDWFAEGTTLYDSNGFDRRAAIRIAWDGTQPGCVGIQYEVRLTADLSHVTRGRTDQLAAGALIISQGIIDETPYQVRGQYLPSSPRDMLWSDWLDVTTPALPAIDIPAWITVQVTTVMDYLNDQLTEIEQRFATLNSTDMARNWTDHQETRSQMTSRTDAAFAEITHVEEVSTSADAALATSISTVDAKLGSGFSSVDTVQKAFVDNQTAFTNYQTAVSAAFGTTNANVTTNANAIATLNGYAAAQYAVTLNVNGYATGFNLLNGGPGVSSTTFTQDKFQIAAPGIGGGAPVPIFTVANVAGAPKIAIRGDMYADGSIFASRIVAGTITANEIAGNTITADRLVTGTITSDSGKIGALSVKSLSVGDNAITVPVAETRGDTINNNAGVTVNSINVSIDTTGLAGKPITVICGWTGALAFAGGGGSATAILYINGVQIQLVATINSADWFFAMSGSYTFTGTGGVVNIPARIDYVANSGVGTTLTNRTLWAMAGKR